MSPVKPRPAVRPSRPRNSPPEVVDPKWLLKALAVCFATALLCGYATLCYLFYQGEWQLVLHPSHAVNRTPGDVGLAYSTVHFDAFETGQPRLTGWWIPAATESGFQPRYSAYTVLYLHDGSGSLSDTIPTLARLHALGLNIFAFDYRGFGSSDASSHPSAESMTQDTGTALEYLTGTRHIAPASIVPYGTGLGASMAASLVQIHPDLPAIILDNPNPDPASTAIAQRPSHIVPVRLLFGNQFDVATPLAALKAPKLLIAGGPNSSPPTWDTAKLQALFHKAGSPRFSVTLPSASGDTEYQAAITRFLDQYLPPR